MKVLEIGTLNVKAGGPPFSMSRQMYGLKKNGIDSVCLMTPCKNVDIIDTSLCYKFTEPIAFKFFGYDYIPQIKKSLSISPPVDIIHIQGVWTYIAHAAVSYARDNNIPYVIAPRGSLYKMAIHGKHLFKKMLAWYLYQKSDIEHANCIQVTCLEELKELRSLGCTNNIAVIPNSYDVKSIRKGTYIDDGMFRIGYLGRLNPRKHVEKLLYSLNELKRHHENVKLFIIGGDNLEYEKFLKDECARLNLNNSVTFTGFLKGDDLDNAIRECNIFAFPSDFENWGNVVPDVLVREIPAITSKGMPWAILEKEKCGWWINIDQETLNSTLLKAYELGCDNLKEMGIRGRRLVEEYYSVEPIGKKLKELYTWIVRGGIKPDFVYY